MEEQKFMVSGQEEKIQGKKNKEDMKLPPLKTKFMIMGQEYIVTYVNEGKKRFTAEPCEGMY
jgi:hypothetical protein